MCGRPLVETPPAPAASRPEPARPETGAPAPAPAYTGGLFNLNAPADRPSRNLDYLLEDDEESKSNKGLILLTLIALALVVGLGWLRWRNGGLPFLKSLTASISQPKPAPSSETPDGTQSSSPPDQPNSGQSNASSTTPGSVSESTGSQPTASPAAPSTSSPAAATSPAPTEGSTAAPAPSTESPAAAAPPPTASVEAGSPNATADKPTEKTAAPLAASTPAPEPAPAPKPKTPAKPAPKPASKATDPVAIGERYLYGREGFPQNCERGLHYVKPAADQSNPKAMITMGALYATGHCLSRDLPTAYRFFALALRGDPENGPLRQNAEMVWKQMTAEERKQAIRMTQ